jgi:hypothetical protein
LALLLVPKPLKLVAIAIAGKRHWLTGTGMIIAAYAASILVVGDCSESSNLKLLTLPCFEQLWTWFVRLRREIVDLIGSWVAVVGASASASNPKILQRIALLELQIAL